MKLISENLVVRMMLAAAVAATLGGRHAMAQYPSDYVPPEMRGVGVDEKLESSIPLDLQFVNDAGNTLTLREYFKPGKPIILTPVYFNCPQLCNLTLNGLVDGLKDVELSAGKEFDIISFSFNPKEDSKLANVKKRAYLTQYRRETAKDGWHFLTTADQQTIDTLLDAIGYRLKYDPKTGDYAHTSTIVFLTPEGRIARYMNDVLFQPRDLRLALIESSQGTIGSPMEKFLLMTCFIYDPEKNSYAASAKKIMKLGGAVTVLLMATGFIILWRKGSIFHSAKQFVDAKAQAMPHAHD